MLDLKELADHQKKAPVFSSRLNNLISRNLRKWHVDKKNTDREASERNPERSLTQRLSAAKNRKKFGSNKQKGESHGFGDCGNNTRKSEGAVFATPESGGLGRFGISSSLYSRTY
jgi:hypothetical protein